jgi:DNA-binding transcriptional ArsR family regulator
MSEPTGEEGDRVFKALADGTRRRLLDELASGPKTTGELCDLHPEMTRFGVMAHLKVLEEASVVLVTREGRIRRRHLNPVPIRQIYERWVRPFAELPAAELTGLDRAVRTRLAGEPRRKEQAR